MDAPTCRICGAKHWSSQPHQFAGGKPKADPDPVTAPHKPAKAKPVAAALAVPPAKKPRKKAPAEKAVVTIAHHKVKDLSPEGIKAIAEGLAKKRGRPKLHPDRKAYKAEKERARRAAAKKADPK